MSYRFLPGAFGVLLFSGALIAAAACSSFDAASVPDDATDEAALADAPAAADGPVVETGADAGTFCTTQSDAEFCADFETTSLDHGWTGEIILADAGVLELLDGGAEASPSHAAGATVSGDPSAPPIDASTGDAAGNRSALLVRAFTVLGAGRVSVDLDVRVDALPDMQPDALASVVGVTDIDKTGQQPSVFVTFRKDSSSSNPLALAVGVGIDVTGSMPMVQGKTIQPLLHTWFHMHLSVDRSTAHAVILQIDGNDVVVQGSTPVFATTNSLELSAGVFGFVNREDMSVAVDNVVVNVFAP